MNALFWLLLGGIGVATGSYLVKTRRSRALASTSDEDFLRIYSRSYPDPADLVLQERKIIAAHLGLPAERLAPHDTFQRLSSYTGFAGEYEVGMGDLEEERRELFEQASLLMPESFPPTVGELIHEIATAKQKIP